jgi:Hemerythrin HHE cation binding domain
MDLAPADDLVSLLTQDHAAVRQRLAEFDSAVAENRSELFWKLTDQLVRHEIGEEIVVYPELRDLPGGAHVADVRMSEEAETESLLARMESLDTFEEPFEKALVQLRESVLNHAHLEETEVFPLLLAHEESGRLIYLGQKFKGAKLAAPNHPHPHLPAGPTSQRLIGPIAAFFDRVRDAARLGV